MSEIYDFRVIVKGRKNACYAFVGSTPYLSERTIYETSGTDSECRLVFYGDCKGIPWIEDYDWQRYKNGVKIPKDPDKALEKGFRIIGEHSFQTRSAMLNLEVMCNWLDLGYMTGEKPFCSYSHFVCGALVKSDTWNVNRCPDYCPAELDFDRGLYKPEVKPWNGSRINWEKPSEEDLRDIDSMLLRATSFFPSVCAMNERSTPEAVASAETMFPGDRVTLSFDWTSAALGEGRIAVSDKNGTQLGFLIHNLYFTDSDSENRSSTYIFACLLPWLNATVWEDIPASFRSKAIDIPEIFVRIELEAPLDCETLISNVHALLGRDCNKRVSMSNGGE